MGLLANIVLFAVYFVLRSFHCIFKIVCPCTTLYLFLAFQLQLNKLEV